MPYQAGTGMGGGGYYLTPMELFQQYNQQAFGGGSGGAGGTTGTVTGTSGGAGTLTGAASKGWTPASGGVPFVPDPATSQASAIAGNKANLSGITGLAGDVNQFNLGEVLKQYESGIPGYSGIAAQSAANIADAMAGKVPADVLAQMSQGAAERGIGMGGAGSPNANAAYLRALGLTSLGQQQYGEQALTGAVNRMPKVGLYNVAGDMVSPEQQQQAQYMANVLNAAPIPQEAYNQAQWMAAQGMRGGYNAARQSVPGGGGSSSGVDMQSVLDIMKKYAPGGGQTAPGETTPTSTGGGMIYPTGNFYSSNDEADDAWYFSGGTSETDYYPWEDEYDY